MKKQEKELEVKNLKEKFNKANMAILTEYIGMSVEEMTAFRKSLREVNAEVKVVKNTLARIASEDTELKILKDYFVGTNALITITGDDPVAPAKALVEIAKKIEKLKIKSGVLSGKLIAAADIEALSKLPSREQMLSSLLGSMNAPAQNLVNVFAAIPRQLVTVLAAVRDQKTA